MTYSYQAALNLALQELQSARNGLRNEIAEYPAPISGCDMQFNDLLSDRARITKAIQALESSPFIPTPRLLDLGARLERR